MNNNDYIPSPDKDFNEWQINLVTNGQPNFAAWGAPAAAVTSLLALKSDWEAKFAVVENVLTKTAVAVLAKKDARKEYESALRVFIKGYITYNPQVTDEDRFALGLPLHSSARTPAPAPTTVPEAEVKLPAPGVVEIHFHDSDSERRGKPFGVRGVEIAWAVLPDTPQSWRELPHSVFDSRSPYVFTFDISERGKKLFFAMRWENTRGEKGHWSEVQLALIP